MNSWCSPIQSCSFRMSPSCFLTVLTAQPHNTHAHRRRFIVSDNEASEVVQGCKGVPFKAAAALFRRNRVHLLKNRGQRSGEGWHDNRHGLAIVAMIWVGWKAVWVRVFAPVGGRQIESFCECVCICICFWMCAYVRTDIRDFTQ